MSEATLPPAPTPMGRYEPAMAHRGIVYTAGMTPRQDGWIICLGHVGVDVDPARALSAAAMAVGGVERIVRLLKLTVFVACGPDFTGHSDVADGASQALTAELGERGRVARTACGVSSLPGGACVEVELVAAYEEELP